MLAVCKCTAACLPEHTRTAYTTPKPNCTPGLQCWAGELPPLETLGRYRAVIISVGAGTTAWRSHPPLVRPAAPAVLYSSPSAFQRTAEQPDAHCARSLLKGGHYSAYEDRQWIQDLAAWLGRAVRQHPGVRYLGVCFGCQILARGKRTHHGSCSLGRSGACECACVC